MKVTQLDIIKFLISFINFILAIVIYVRNLFKSEVFLNKVKLSFSKLIQYVKLIYNSSKYKEYNQYLKYSGIVKPEEVFTSSDNNSSVMVIEDLDNYRLITPGFSYILKFINVKNNISASIYVTLINANSEIKVNNNDCFWLQDYTTLKLFRVRKDNIKIIEKIELKTHEVQDVSLDDVILNAGEVVDIKLRVSDVIVNYEDNTYTIIYEDGLEQQYTLPNI